MLYLQYMGGNSEYKGTCMIFGGGAEKKGAGERPSVSVVARTTRELGSLCGGSAFST